MRPLLILPLLFPLLFASKILSYSIHDSTGRVDVMLTFDIPYKGVLRQSRLQDKIIIKLEDATIESPKVKSTGSSFLTRLAITPFGSQTQIIATTAAPVAMEASKTSNALGLRLRFTERAAAPLSDEQGQKALSALPTKPDNAYNGSYYVVITILIIGIAILFWLKNRIAQPPVSGPGKPWRFVMNTLGKKKSGNDVNIRFQKALDPKNRIVMLDYADESYLLLIGSSNLLLDRFQGERPVTEDQFDAVLQNKHEELDSFLRLETETKGPLQSYKEKASGIDGE
jgi:hypothetical protein